MLPQRRCDVTYHAYQRKSCISVHTVFLPVLKIVVGNFDITDIHPTRCGIHFLAGSRGLNLACPRVLENEHAEIQRLDYLLHPQKRVNIAIPKEPLR